MLLARNVASGSQCTSDALGGFCGRSSDPLDGEKDGQLREAAVEGLGDARLLVMV
jgi:hypothetical protein